MSLRSGVVTMTQREGGMECDGVQVIKMKVMKMMKTDRR